MIYYHSIDLHTCLESEYMTHSKHAKDGITIMQGLH
jgi:hypothetical protein